MKYIKKLIYVLLLTVATQVATAQIKILYAHLINRIGCFLIVLAAV